MILDTNALSALADRDPDLETRIHQAPRLLVTLISLGEFEYGICQSRKKAELRKWLEAFLKWTDVLSPNKDTLSHYAKIRIELKRAGTPIPANDCWIAALARQHKLPIVSRDRHFDQVSGIKRIGW